MHTSTAGVSAPVFGRRGCKFGFSSGRAPLNDQLDITGSIGGNRENSQSYKPISTCLTPAKRSLGRSGQWRCVARPKGWLPAGAPPRLCRRYPGVPRAHGRLPRRFLLEAEPGTAGRACARPEFELHPGSGEGVRLAKALPHHRDSKAEGRFRAAPRKWTRRPALSNDRRSRPSIATSR